MFEFYSQRKHRMGEEDSFRISPCFFPCHFGWLFFVALQRWFFASKDLPKLVEGLKKLPPGKTWSKLIGDCLYKCFIQCEKYRLLTNIKMPT